MKRGSRIASLVILMTMAGFAGAQTDTPSPAADAGVSTSVGTIQVKNVSISGISVSHVEVGVSLMLTPTQSATLKNTQICSLRLNGLPVFASPLAQEIVLHRGEAIALPQIAISVFFRDLNTARPLRQMIEKQSVHVQGEMVSSVQVGFLGKLALHSQHPKVMVPISQDVAVELGGSSLERNLALGVLQALDTEMENNGTAAKLIDGIRPAWIRDLETAAQPNLYAVESSYAVSQGTTPSRVNAEALGFRMASGKVMTTAEMLSPWKYDAEFLSALNGGSVKLVKKSEELALRAVDGSGAGFLQGTDFTSEPHGTPEGDKMTAVGKTRDQVQLLRRASPASMAVLTLKAAAPAGGLTAAPATVQAQDTWDKVIVFRLHSGATANDRSVEPLQVGATREGNSIHLTQPIDDAVFGSPILTPDGVIGIVQDEQTGAFLPPDLDATKP